MKARASKIQPAAALKLTLVTVLMLLFYVQMWAVDQQPPFSSGEQIEVVSPSGLTLRTLPNKNSKSLGVIPFGETVLVLNQDSSLLSETINYVEGNWIKIDFEGEEGYVFDGFLSVFPLPEYDFEHTTLDMDLIYPLETYVETRFRKLSEDTLVQGEIKKRVSKFADGVKMVKTDDLDVYKLELTFEHARIMDVYHLLESMLREDKQREIFAAETIFINNGEDKLDGIKIYLDHTISIKKLGEGKVRLSVYSQDYFCGL